MLLLYSGIGVHLGRVITQSSQGDRIGRVTDRADELSRRRIPIFSYYRGRLSCRFNQKQIEDAAIILEKPLSALEQEVIEYVSTLALRSDIRFKMKFERGDLQRLNNHCILHAREAYEDDPVRGRRRLLLRMWINLPNGRALAPDFADRLNTGPRGEVAVLKSPGTGGDAQAPPGETFAYTGRYSLSS